MPPARCLTSTKCDFQVHCVKAVLVWLFSRADGDGKIIHVVEEGSLAVPDLDASI